MTTVLVVDDEPVLRAVVRDVLVEAGYTVAEAADGTAMLALVERDRPDLVLMDVMMPGGDGQEAYRTLRGQPGLPTVPVVMMSAAVHPNGLDPTIAAFLPKPFALDRLLATVVRLIGSPTPADHG
jgi:CheY-like chemotaxis protein